eukprot:TRINITY_DN8285_c0_g1_i1.p1 TRINITY_DN8285_c0_g1~~TRINITY_DN8285_c0_g1_i1.p1  ORF type:complete len:61 (+),score=17.95 TRINITY_DN8285_c0_g1_i1:116-298(+)
MENIFPISFVIDTSIVCHVYPRGKVNKLRAKRRFSAIFASLHISSKTDGRSSETAKAHRG